MLCTPYLCCTRARARWWAGAGLGVSPVRGRPPRDVGRRPARYRLRPPGAPLARLEMRPACGGSLNPGVSTCSLAPPARCAWVHLDAPIPHTPSRLTTPLRSTHRLRTTPAWPPPDCPTPFSAHCPTAHLGPAPGRGGGAGRGPGVPPPRLAQSAGAARRGGVRGRPRPRGRRIRQWRQVGSRVSMSLPPVLTGCPLRISHEAARSRPRSLLHRTSPHTRGGAPASAPTPAPAPAAPLHHRDVRAAAVLLAEDWRPLVVGAGLSRCVCECVCVCTRTRVCVCVCAYVCLRSLVLGGYQAWCCARRHPGPL